MLNKTYTLTIAASECAGDGKWSSIKEYPWEELANILTSHKQGEKSGSCYIPGKLSKPRRIKENVETLEMLVLDIDAGYTFEEIESKCNSVGWVCAIATSYSHLKNQTAVNLEAFNKSGLSPAEFLEQKVKLLPQIAKDAEEVSQNANEITFKHNQCPRIRLIIPLERPWRRANYDSIKASELAWIQANVRVAYALGLSNIDTCSTRLTQPYYSPRFPKDGPKPQATILKGKLIDVWSLPDPPHAPMEIRSKLFQEDDKTKGQGPGSASEVTSRGIIGEFNRCFSIEEILTKYGYKQVEKDRFLCPHSTNGSPGVVLLDDGSSIYSHHSTDPLADGYAHDAFDCFRIIEHDGDIRFALKAAIKHIPDKAVATLNQFHAFTTIGSKAVILYEKSLTGDDGCSLDFLTPAAFREKYCNRFIPVGNEDKAKSISLGKYWLNSTDRREVEGVYFDPAGTRRDWHNMWTGFSVKPTDKPEPNKYNLYRQHVEEIICNGNAELIRYVWAWMANLVQAPARKIGIALVLRGGRGTGKGCFVKPLQRLLGRHSMQIHNRSQLTGRFNGHFADKLLVFVDEGYCTADKQGEGILKGLITEEDLSVERKGIDAFSIKNYSRFIIAGNEHWIVPAGIDERRFCVLEVSDRKAQDHKYFAPIFEQMEKGGDEALLRFLLDYNLSDINLRKVPATQALLDQITSSFNSVQAFWFEILQEGSLYIDDNSQESQPWDNDSIFIQNNSLYQKYLDYCTKQNTFTTKQSAFIKTLFSSKGLCPRANKFRPNKSGNRQRGYLIPRLEDCRKHFERVIKFEGGIKW
jgi:hypothetical protein